MGGEKFTAGDGGWGGGEGSAEPALSPAAALAV